MCAILEEENLLHCPDIPPMTHQHVTRGKKRKKGLAAFPPADVPSKNLSESLVRCRKDKSHLHLSHAVFAPVTCLRSIIMIEFLQSGNYVLHTIMTCAPRELHFVQGCTVIPLQGNIMHRSTQFSPYYKGKVVWGTQFYRFTIRDMVALCTSLTVKKAYIQGKNCPMYSMQISAWGTVLLFLGGGGGGKL